MTGLSLRLRIFLFFALIALGGTAIVCAGLWLGFRQLGDPGALSAFVTSAIVAGFGIVGLTVVVWLLFDENVSKPIETLAARFRVNTHAVTDGAADDDIARYLGDLAPAAQEIQRKLGQVSHATAETVAQQTARLKRQRAQLLRILSDIPVAVIVMRADHQIVLYDGQAAELMEGEAPVRLNGSVFDYLDATFIQQTLAEMRAEDQPRREVAITGNSGAVYTGHLRLFGADEGYCLMLEPLAPDAARPLVYDFDLLDRAGPGDLDGSALRDLTFVVFDSETTGLDPAKDDVVQLGAVRVVNGKIVPGEVFDTLVNPGRAIPPGSTRVHGISDAMVADAPRFDAACAGFHQFASAAVIVAHNAPFDMAFLHRECESAAFGFDHPVLDTVHLSAVVFGGSAEHTLDALCDRLGIEIPPDLRHTALGDAVATAQVLVALLPILEARGLHSYAAVRAEARKHARLLKLAD